MAIDLSNYATVAERITKAKTTYPEGRFQSRIVDLPEAFASDFLAVEAKFFRTPDDPTPAVGLAWEPVPGTTPYTRQSELQNAESSAWGRALIAAFAADASKGIASREEVRNRTAGPPLPEAVNVAKRTLLEHCPNRATAKALWKEAASSFGYGPDEDPEDLLDDVLKLALELAGEQPKVEKVTPGA